MSRLRPHTALTSYEENRWKGEPSEAIDNYHDPDLFDIEAKDHRFIFYPAGVERLAALKQHIETAQRTLDIYFYLFQEDEAGELVRDALVAAAQRGVAVRLIVDAFGSDASRAFFDPLVEAGGCFDEFSPRWNVRYLIRNHQKFAIADSEWVMTGGFNVSDHYFQPPEDNGWCDLGVAIEGPVVEQFARWFDLLRRWTENNGSQLRAIRSMVSDWDAGDGPVRLLVGGPLLRRSHWAWSFRQDLIGATRLDTVSAYFSPPRSVRRQIARVARRGKVRMIAAGKSDVDASIDVARLLFKRLLRAGARIFEFRPCKLHMKLLVVDDIAYVGSANLDKRSFRVNVELMVRIEDAEVARSLRAMIDHLEAASDELTPEKYKREATFFTRLRWRLTYLLALADYRVARGLNS